MKKYKGFFPLSGRIITKKLIGFDCETFSDKNIFRLCSFVFDDSYKTFYSKREAIKYIFNNKRIFQGNYIVATNLLFDLTALFYDEPEFNKLKLVWNKSTLISAHIKFNDSNKHGDIVFIDTLNFNNRSVKELGVIIGQDKILIDKRIFDKKVLNNDELKYLKEYNINDAEISVKYMRHLQKTLNNLGGNLKTTLPSSALDLFRRKFQKYRLIKEELILNDKSITEFILKSYYGGRTENYAKGDFDKVYYYDVNSLYPFSMLNNFPNPSSVNIGNNTEFEILNFMGVTECEVKIDKMNIPILPHHYKDKLIYPIGTFTGIWTNELLKYALENGYKILKINKQIIYTEMTPFFKDYVNELYALRMKYKSEHNNEEQTCKLLLNSLYGKFAQKPNDLYEIFDMNFIDTKTMVKKIKQGYKIIPNMKERKYIFSKITKRYPRHAFPILSSYVTSYAMIHMHKILNKYTPLYTDTDSIMTQEQLPDEFIGKELGKFKLEKMGKINIDSPKCYLFNNIPTAKGIKITTSEEYYNYINFCKIEQTRFIKLKSALHSLKYKPNQIIKIEKRKHILNFNKREFIDKYSTPLKLNNGVYKNV